MSAYIGTRTGKGKKHGMHASVIYPCQYNVCTDPTSVSHIMYLGAILKHNVSQSESRTVLFSQILFLKLIPRPSGRSRRAASDGGGNISVRAHLAEL